MNQEKIFKNYEEAEQQVINVPWKVAVCLSGEECWCRAIVPEEPIVFFDKQGQDSIDEIIPQGSVHKTIAEYIVRIHNLEALRKLSDLDQELGLA